MFDQNSFQAKNVLSAIAPRNWLVISVTQMCYVTTDYVC